MASAPIQIHLKSGTILSAKSFDDRATQDASVFIGMDDETIVVPNKTEITALILDDDAAKEYFGY